jgi:hypothetical protein
MLGISRRIAHPTPFCSGTSSRADRGCSFSDRDARRPSSALRAIASRASAHARLLFAAPPLQFGAGLSSKRVAVMPRKRRSRRRHRSARPCRRGAPSGFHPPPRVRTCTAATCGCRPRCRAHWQGREGHITL